MSGEGMVHMFDGEDPRMVQAIKNARATFKYFWREMSWEYRRIIPGHDLSSIKIAFKTDGAADSPTHEQMWINELQFNGEFISGILLNEPNWVSNLHAGDAIKAPLNDVSDWMYSIHEKVYGAYTVNLLRSDMSRGERREHDDAWGLDFGAPDKIDIFYQAPVKKSLFSFFSKPETVSDQELMGQEHPMCLNMEDSLREQLQENNEMLTSADEYGNTMMHSDALAGNAPVVKIFREFGADPALKNRYGKTPLQLAKMLNWQNVMAVLS